jgi:uncharacterized protein YndB with AHSA1/START domain
VEINQKAPVISRHEIMINAPVETVWRIHTDVSSWSDWNPDIVKSEISGPIAVGTVFHWKTAGLEIPSRIGEVVPLRKIAWSGETGGILGVHVWTFSSRPGGTTVRTEESWEGRSLPSQVQDLQRQLDASLISWLSHLKNRAEAPLISSELILFGNSSEASEC